MDNSNAILSAYAEAVRHGKKLQGKSVDHEQFDLPVAFLNIASTGSDELLSDRFAVAHALDDYPEFEALQVVTPDDAGRFPWDEDCEPGLIARQPLLGHPLPRA